MQVRVWRAEDGSGPIKLLKQRRAVTHLRLLMVIGHILNSFFCSRNENGVELLDAALKLIHFSNILRKIIVKLMLVIEQNKGY